MVALFSLLSRGYFAKEIPPSFSSAHMAAYLAGVGATSPPSPFVGAARPVTHPTTHRLARPHAIARRLSTPQPVSYFRQASEIAAAWTDIVAQFAKSTISVTAPTVSSGDRAVAPPETTDLLDKRARERATLRYVLFADVSNCYPTIYTHSLPWALHSKAVAKANPTDYSLLGNRLDRDVRFGQGRQTAGIPVGPDTSHVLAELVLASCDAELSARGKVRGFRFYDDYELYFPDRQSAERSLAQLEAILSSYQLALNPRKTSIAELPIEIDESWVRNLKRIDIPKNPVRERSALTLLFDEAYEHGKKYPERHVLSYALGRFGNRLTEESILVHGDNWGYMQSLLMQAIRTEPGTASKAYYILAWGRDQGMKLDKALLSESLTLAAAEYSTRGETSEVAWVIWAAAALGLFIGRTGVEAAARLEDDFVALVSLFARDQGRLSKAADVTSWSAWATQSELRAEHWLFAYEAYEQGWLAAVPDPILGNPEFEYLRAGGIRLFVPPPTVPTPAALPKFRLAPMPPGKAGYA